MKFWFLAYEYEPKNKPSIPPGVRRSANVVLAGVHPLVWLSSPPDSFRSGFVQYALFFQEIDEPTFETLSSLAYISVEDHRGR